MSLESYPKYLTGVPYSEESRLNTLEVCLPRPVTPNNPRLWIVFVHGGAWMDPLIDASCFHHTQEKLLHSTHADEIAGYASINYRLSPYPSHPDDPSDPSDPSRNAHHPDHINDVLTALLHLQSTYHFDDRYLLVGHSCGAALALQVAMRRYWGAQYESTLALELNVVPPRAILGLEGIYDLPALVAAHDAFYRDFVVNAFGSASHWESVSPARADFSESWPDGELVVLGHSPDDKLVEMEQPELQLQALKRQGWGGPRRDAVLLELKGNHDEVWMSDEAARAVEYVLTRLKASQQHSGVGS